MNGKPKTSAFWSLLLVAVCIFSLGNAGADSEPLTRVDIETTMAVREKADALRLERLDRASAEKSGKEESFAEILAKIQHIGQEADRQACDEQGIPVQEYRGKLRRLIKVGELVFFEDIKNELQKELRQRQAKTEADLIKEAEQTLASTEQWFEGVQGRTATAGEGDQGKPAVAGGYADSLEQIVMEPMRRQAADGELPETVRLANEKRCEEIRQQLSKINQQLSTPSLSQAVLDKPAVLALLDRGTLQELSSSLIEDIPIAGQEE